MKCVTALATACLLAACGYAGEPAKYDPYGYGSDYAAFRAAVARPNGWGVLYVGVEDKSVGTYQVHCRVESGFKGLADGVYDCRHADAPGGQPVMTKRAAVALPMAHCTGRGCNCGPYGNDGTPCGCTPGDAAPDCPMWKNRPVAAPPAYYPQPRFQFRPLMLGGS